MSSRLLVFGGNGHLGKRICQQAINSGCQVTSVSRSGKPPTPITANDKHWIKEVQWKHADVLNPETYVEYLKDSTDVVHSVGVLFENESYKKVINQGPSSIINNLFSSKGSMPNRNPLLYPNSTPTGEETKNKLTYDLINTQSATTLASTFDKLLRSNSMNYEVTSKPTFTYISADRGFAVVPKGYINSKRATDAFLLKLNNEIDTSFRSIIVRPGFMYDELNTAQFKNFRTVLHDVMEVLYCGNKLILNNRFQTINDLIRPTSSFQSVARSVVCKIQDKKFKGIVSLEDILQN